MATDIEREGNIKIVTRTSYSLSPEGYLRLRTRVIVKDKDGNNQVLSDETKVVARDPAKYVARIEKNRDVYLSQRSSINEEIRNFTEQINEINSL